jgi:hypothetical protein
MTEPVGTPSPRHEGFLTDADEMSLAQSQARQTDSSQPDTLEVRGDSWSLLQEELGPLRRPAQLALGALAVGLLVIVGGGLLSRIGRHRVTA